MRIGLKRLFVPISLSMLSSLPSLAQFAGNYFDAELSGGVQSPTYSPLNAGITRTGGIGGGISIGYRHFFSDNFGIGTGFGVRFFNAYGKCQFVERDSVFSTSTPYLTNGDRQVEQYITTTYDQWTEKQKFIQLEVPIGLYYQREIGYKMSFIAGAGALIGFPVKAKFNVREGNIEQKVAVASSDPNSANAVQSAIRLNSEEEDFESDLDRRKGSLGFFINVAIQKWTKKGVGYYAGLYGNYTASDVVVFKNDNITGRNGTYNGILASNQVTDVNLLSLGVKFGVSLPLQKKKRKEDLPDNAPLVAEEPIVNVRDSITHLPDSLIYVRYSREEVAKVKRLIANMPEVEAVDAHKKLEYVKVISAYEELSSFEKLDITWTERGKIKQADYALNGEQRLAELCETMNSEVQFGYMQSGFTSTKKLESAFDDLTFLMKLLPNATLIIEGRADDKEQENDPALAKERALFLREILMKKGVAGDQIEIEALGAKNPVAPFTSDENRAKNRTVTFKAQQ